MPPRWQNLKREPDLFFVNTPFAQFGISLSKKNDVQIHFGTTCQRIEQRNSIRRDDFRDDNDAALHAAHSRYMRATFSACCSRVNLSRMVSRAAVPMFCRLRSSRSNIPRINASSLSFPGPTKK